MTYSCYTFQMDGREDDFDEESGQVKFLDVYKKEYMGKEMAVQQVQRLRDNRRD